MNFSSVLLPEGGTMYKVTNGTQYIKLYAQAAYKAPEHLESHLAGAKK